MPATDLNYRIVCEISDALKSVTASKLYSLQARISFNGFDFSELKKDRECIILCHSFKPLSITPNACLSPTPLSATSSSDLSNDTEKVIEAQSSRPMMKEICVIGESFFPSRCLPLNYTVQAIVTAIFPILTSETAKEESNGDTINSEISNTNAISNGHTGANTVSTVVPVRCMSQTVMCFTPPTINHFIDLYDKKWNEEEYNLVKTSVQFQLVSKDSAAVRDTSGFFPRHDKKENSTITTEEKGENIQWLCSPEIGREDLVLHLFTNQAIIISPAVTRRHGGTAHKVRGALHGGFRCCPYPDLVRVVLKTEGDDGEVLLDPPQVTVHKKRTSTVIKTVLTQDEDTAVASGLPPVSAFHHLTELDAEFEYHFVMPSTDTSVQQGTSKPLQYVVTSLLFDNDSDVLSAPTFRLLLFDGVKIGAVVNPKGGHSQGSQVIVAVTGIPDCVKSCIIQISGDEKDKNAMSVTPTVSGIHVEILGVQVRDGNQEISFLLPELSNFQILTPFMMKKAKMYFIHISVDEGSSFDSSAAAVLQIQ